MLNKTTEDAEVCTEVTERGDLVFRKGKSAKLERLNPPIKSCRLRVSRIVR